MIIIVKSTFINQDRIIAKMITGGSTLSSFETIVLLTVDETIDALRKAGQVQYRTPDA
jgi:hypothetical protein